MNGFFRVDDYNSLSVGNHAIDQSWWSRKYEYPWVFRQVVEGAKMADLGCGWWPRPLKDALSDMGSVWAIDAHKNVLQMPDSDNLVHVHADFTEKMQQFEDGFFDIVFCISVLEDLSDHVSALTEFKRLSSGPIVLTFDVPYDDDKPCPHYPGLMLTKFERAMKAVGLKYVGEVNYSKDNALVHGEFNLCVFHCVLTDG